MHNGKDGPGFKEDPSPDDKYFVMTGDGVEAWHMGRKNTFNPRPHKQYGELANDRELLDWVDTIIMPGNHDATVLQSPASLDLMFNRTTLTSHFLGTLQTSACMVLECLLTTG